jgi:crotonobetainyl-CoA:carnitine CoA-transferase CaiB-like acyl-CoA transferase
VRDLDVLKGLRVLDMSVGVAPGFAARLLGDHGAEVIKVEQPSGDPLRQDVAGTCDFAYANVGKRSIVLDLDSDEGRGVLDRLLDRTDLVIESFTASDRERYRVDADRLRSGRESLIVISVSPFGTFGPYRDWRASEHVVYGMGHEMYALGEADLPPGPLAPYVVWGTVALSTAMLAAAALYGVLNGQPGAHYDVSAMEAMVASIDRRAHTLVAYAYTGEHLTRGHSPAAFPGYAVRCKDGYVSIGANASWWDPFRRAVGVPELLTEEFASAPKMHEVSAEANAAWRAWCDSRTKLEITDLLQSVGVPCEPMNTVADLLAHDQFAARDYFQPVEVEGQPGLVPGPPVKLGDLAPRDVRHSPALGQHTVEVLTEVGLDEATIARLSQEART